MSDVSFSIEAWKVWGHGYDSDTCVATSFEDSMQTYTGPSFGNSFLLEQGELDGNAATSRAALSIDASYIGPPIILQTCPDGTEIISALAEVTCTRLTRTHQHVVYGYSDCSGTVVEPGSDVTDTTVTDISYTIARITSSAGDIEIIQTIAGAAEGTRVVDIKPLCEDMLTQRASGGSHRGYAIFANPAGLTDAGDITALVPGEAPTRVTTVCPGGACEGLGYLVYAQYDKQLITWSSLTMGKAAIKVNYPDSDKDRLMILKRWPRFSA